LPEVDREIVAEVKPEVDREVVAEVKPEVDREIVAEISVVLKCWLIQRGKNSVTKCDVHFCTQAKTWG
jgi:hypothetical protein